MEPNPNPQEPLVVEIILTNRSGDAVIHQATIQMWRLPDVIKYAERLYYITNDPDPEFAEQTVEYREAQVLSL